MTAATQHTPVPGPLPDTPEWREAHRTHITATDIAPILGRSDYKTALDVFAEKKGLVPPFEGNEHTRRGKRYEPVILADYAEAVGCEIEAPLPLYYHPAISFLAATPDAFVPEWDHDQMLPAVPGHGVEAKLTMSPRRAVELGDEGTDSLPDDWLLQGQTQLAVMGWDYVDFAVLLFGKLKVYKTHREPDLIEIIESAAKEFHERLENNDPPEPNWEHSQTPRLIKSLYGVSEGVEVTLEEEIESYWSKYQDLGEEIKQLESKREAHKARVLDAMGDAAIGYCPSLGVNLVRSQVKRKEYTVAATSYIQLRQRKA